MNEIPQTDRHTNLHFVVYTKNHKKNMRRLLCFGGRVKGEKDSITVN